MWIGFARWAFQRRRCATLARKARIISISSPPGATRTAICTSARAGYFLWTAAPGCGLESCMRSLPGAASICGVPPLPPIHLISVARGSLQRPCTGEDWPLSVRSARGGPRTRAGRPAAVPFARAGASSQRHARIRKVTRSLSASADIQKARRWLQSLCFYCADASEASGSSTVRCCFCKLACSLM